MAKLQKVRGGCHCGKIKFTAQLDLTAPTVRCNCSICSKTRAWLTFVPKKNFELHTGPEQLNAYQFGPHQITHFSCCSCGVRTFGKFGTLDSEGDLALSVTALDLAPEKLAELQIAYLDGANDDFENPPAITSHL